jgi:iron complex transport system substrate-binding protein
MKHRLIIPSLLAIFVLLLTACSGISPSPSSKISLTDGMARTVELASPAVKVVSLAPSNTEILYALDAGLLLVGRDEFSNYPEKAKAVASVGGNMGNYDLETIAALKPDLVLASGLNTPEQVKSLEQLGLTVYVLPNPKDLDGLYQNIATVGQLTGFNSQANELITSLKTRVEAVEDKISTVDTRPVVFYELDGSDPAQPWTTGPGTFLSNLIGMAGGTNAGDDLTSEFAQISLESLLVKDPATIILGDSNYGMDLSQVATRQGWYALSAVRDGKVVPFDDDLVSRPGPRLVDGLEALAKLIHPEAFGN